MTNDYTIGFILKPGLLGADSKIIMMSKATQMFDIMQALFLKRPAESTLTFRFASTDVTAEFRQILGEYPRKEGEVIEIVKRQAEVLAQSQKVFAFGGDGTMLGVMRLAAKMPTDNYQPILFGVNMGTLGFITDIPYKHAISLLSSIIFEKAYGIERRNTLQVDFLPDVAANDVLLQRKSGRLLDFTVSLDDCFAYGCRADGLLISTPTGSTAYSLAAGGPIIAPHVNATLLTPLMPQNLAARSLVIDCNTKITVALTGSQDAILYIDGVEFPTFAREFRISLGPNVKFGYPLLDPEKPGRDFTSALREKLGWYNPPNIT